MLRPELAYALQRVCKTARVGQQFALQALEAPQINLHHCDDNAYPLLGFFWFLRLFMTITAKILTPYPK